MLKTDVKFAVQICFLSATLELHIHSCRLSYTQMTDKQTNKHVPAEWLVTVNWHRERYILMAIMK